MAAGRPRATQDRMAGGRLAGLDEGSGRAPEVSGFVPEARHERDMLEGWWAAMAVGILLLVTINAPIFLGACYEWSASSRKDPWLRCTQVLEGRDGGARSSVILLHGFGGTPSDLRVLAERLADRGFRAIVPAIPDQTSTTFAYGRGRVSPADHAEWLLDLIGRETAASGRPPSLVGFSMGGALATLVAADHAVAKLVLISPYFNLPERIQWVAVISNWLRWIVPVVPKVAKGQILDPEGYKTYATGSYFISLRAAQRLAELTRIARARAPHLTLPTLVLASKRDVVASFGTTEELFRGLDNARLVACDRSDHIVTYDYDRELVLMEALSFLAPPMPQDRA
jgi:carboxylesterase